jgi:hypothetical protein
MIHLRIPYLLVLTVLLSTICNSLSAQVVNTGYLTTNAADISDRAFGSGNEIWNNPGNAATDNNSYATISNAALLIGGTQRNSNYLEFKNFGFSIPEGNEVMGIQVEIRRFCTDNSGSNWTRDLEIRLTKGGTIVGDNQANTTSNWPSTETAATYGSQTDLWGITMTKDEINNPDFGVSIAIQSRAAGLLLPTVVSYIDQVRIMVYYRQQILPVNLKGFQLNRTASSGIQLQWQTLSEQHNKGFLIFRKTTDGEFRQIGMVSGNGNSSIERHYQFLDSRPAIGSNYYKLIQQNLDGTQYEIGLKSIEFNLDSPQSWASFEPQSGRVNLGFPTDRYTALSIFDTSGKRWATHSISAGDSSKSLPLANYPKGIYLIQLKGNATMETLKLIIP